MKINHPVGGLSRLLSGQSENRQIQQSTLSAEKEPGPARPVPSKNDQLHLHSDKLKQARETQKAEAKQKLMRVQKKLEALRKQIKVVSEHHAKALMNQLKLLSVELKQAVVQYKQATSESKSVPNLNFSQGAEQNGSSNNLFSANQTLAGLGSKGKNSEFQEALSKIKGDMKALIRMAKSAMQNDDDRKDADKLSKKLDDMRLEEGNASDLQINLVNRISQAIGADADIPASVTLDVPAVDGTSQE